MGDSMPSTDVDRCTHPWDYVAVVEQKTVVGEMEMTVDTTDVYFCDKCENVIEET